jgi:hypothetical protein
VKKTIQEIVSTITFVELLNFSIDGFSFNFVAYVDEQKFVIILEGILSFSLSRDSTEKENRDGIDVLEFDYVFGNLTESSLGSYSYYIDNLEDLTQLYCITVHGSGSVVKVVCKSIEIRDAD